MRPFRDRSVHAIRHLVSCGFSQRTAVGLRPVCLPADHLIEIHEKPWCPASLRDAATDYLQLTATLANLYANLAPVLDRALDRAGTRRIIDLCSGGGGPWFRLHAALEAEEKQPEPPTPQK